MAYRRGAFGQTIITCKLTKDSAEISIEEQHDHYHPAREWYEVIVRRGEQMLQQRVRAGQGKVTLQL